MDTDIHDEPRGPFSSEPRWCERSEDWIVSLREPRDWTRGARRIEAENARTPVRQAIDGAQWILALEDDWDEAGAAKYDPAVLRRAEAFLRESADWLDKTQGRVLVAPDIAPGPKGSIDLHWRLPRLELLLNVPANPAAPITFYGDDRHGFVIRGSAMEAGGPLFTWLTTNSQ